MPQLNRRQISLRTSVWERASRLRDALATASGRKMTISDTIDRALECLEDANSRGAWLTPKDAAPVLEERVRQEIVSILAQFIARTMGDRKLHGVSFDHSTPGGGMVVSVHLDDTAVPLLTGLLDRMPPVEGSSTPTGWVYGAGGAAHGQVWADWKGRADG